MSFIIFLLAIGIQSSFIGVFAIVKYPIYTHSLLVTFPLNFNLYTSCPLLSTCGFPSSNSTSSPYFSDIIRLTWLFLPFRSLKNFFLLLLFVPPSILLILFSKSCGREFNIESSFLASSAR